MCSAPLRSPQGARMTAWSLASSCQCGIPLQMRFKEWNISLTSVSVYLYLSNPHILGPLQVANLCSQHTYNVFVSTVVLAQFKTFRNCTRITFSLTHSFLFVLWKCVFKNSNIARWRIISFWTFCLVSWFPFLESVCYLVSSNPSRDEIIQVRRKI